MSPAEPCAERRDFRGLSGANLEFLRSLIYRQSRIQLDESKRQLLVSRIGRRLRATGLPSVDAYCDFLRSNAGSDEVEHLIDVISTNHTHFMREPKHFEFVRQTVLPQWINARSSSAAEFVTWCAGCSSGEEPYTLAMAIDDMLHAHAQKAAWSIIATDISHSVLERARDGVYSTSALELLPEPWRKRYFRRLPGTTHVRVCDEIRARILFYQMNLLGERAPIPCSFDSVFCRNVMIYFDEETRESLVERIYIALKPGGYLMIGHSESLNGLRHRFEAVRPSTYKKPR